MLIQSETKILFWLHASSGGFEADGMEKEIESVADLLVETIELREAVLLKLFVSGERPE